MSGPKTFLPKTGLVVLLVATSVVVAGAAFAYWTASSGVGSYVGTASNPQNLTLSAATPTGQLFPGSSTAVAVTITNPNSYSVSVHTLSLDTSQGSAGFAVDLAHSACSASSAALVFTSPSANWTVPASGSFSPALPANTLAMGANAASACQGATFTVYLKVT